MYCQERSPHLDVLGNSRTIDLMRARCRKDLAGMLKCHGCPLVIEILAHCLSFGFIKRISPASLHNTGQKSSLVQLSVFFSSKRQSLY